LVVATSIWNLTVTASLHFMLIKDYLDNIIRLIFGKMETNLGYMRVHPSALVSRIKKKKAFSRGWIPNSFSKYSHSANPLSCRKYTDFFDFHKLLYSKFGKVGGGGSIFVVKSQWHSDYEKDYSFYCIVHNLCSNRNFCTSSIKWISTKLC